MSSSTNLLHGHDVSLRHRQHRAFPLEPQPGLTFSKLSVRRIMSIKPTQSVALLLAVSIATLLGSSCSSDGSSSRSVNVAATVANNASVDSVSTTPSLATTPATESPTTSVPAAPAPAPVPTAAPVKPVASAPVVKPAITSAPVATAQPAPVAPAASGPAVITGTVMQVYSNGDFVLNDAHGAFTVVMQASTSVINLRGSEVIRQYIQASNTVKVIGSLSGSNLTAQTVVVQTIKDGL